MTEWEDMSDWQRKQQRLAIGEAVNTASFAAANLINDAAHIWRHEEGIRDFLESLAEEVQHLIVGTFCNAANENRDYA